MTLVVFVIFKSLQLNAEGMPSCLLVGGWDGCDAARRWRGVDKDDALGAILRRSLMPGTMRAI
jgi:hypothetical protein